MIRTSYLRHKCRLTRFVHREFFPKGSTMVTFPLFGFWQGKPDRSILAASLRKLRNDPAKLQEFKSLACF